MRLLIIDDEPHIRHMMRLTLESAGYQVDEAADGQSGLDLFGDGTRYDAVLLDQKMPGLDGLETLRRIKSLSPDACVVMVTAFGSIELAVDAMRLGATDFLRKPMTPETLRGAVAASIASKTAARPARRLPADRTAADEIPLVTMNGFTILRTVAPPQSTSSAHVFRVKHIGDGVETLVTVAIDPEAVDRVARLTHRRLPAEGAFWRAQAERLLSAWIWSEGRVPEIPLVVRDVSPEDLEIAARWPDF